MLQHYKVSIEVAVHLRTLNHLRDGREASWPSTPHVCMNLFGVSGFHMNMNIFLLSGTLFLSAKTGIAHASLDADCCRQYQCHFP